MKRENYGHLSLLLTVVLSSANALPAKAQAANSVPPLALATAIRTALTNNPEIRVLATDIRLAKGESITTKTWQNPEISVAPGYKQFRNSSDKQFHGDFGLSQTIEWPGKRALRKAAAEKNVTVRQLALEGYRTQLAIQVRKAYFSLLAAQAATGLQLQRLRLAQEFVAAAQKKVEGGYAPEFEATKAEVEVVTAQKAWREAQAQADAAHITLNSLMGNPPDASLNLGGALKTESAMPETFALLDLAMQQNPAIKVQEAEAERAGLNAQSIRKSRLPDFTVGPQVEYTRDEQIFDFGISVPLPLWNNKQGEIACATAEQEKALAELDQLKKEILRDVTSASKSYAAAKDSLAYYTPAMQEKLKSASAAATQGYAEGRVPLLLYLETQRTYFDTQADYLETLQKLYAAQADVESAAGIYLEPTNQTPLN